MSKILKCVMVVITLVVGSVAYGLPIVGSYEQNLFEAPREFKQSEEDVTIERDPKSSKKIWVSGIIPNQKFYALVHMRQDERMLFTVPPQTVGDYQIDVGCITYDDDDKSILISLNNKSDCAGMDSVDVSIGKEGVQVGDVRVGMDGSVAAGPAKVGKDGSVKVSYKVVGVTFMGTKVETE